MNEPRCKCGCTMPSALTVLDDNTYICYECRTGIAYEKHHVYGPGAPPVRIPANWHRVLHDPRLTREHLAIALALKLHELEVLRGTM